ncbi:hypothetical protein M3212_13975 [Alkalihalobacillus oceani]|uniref:hypothetical protein n=1 Tax=Halalkalibacter oceani TaxID=1653776 RepID=UPI00203ACC24|nr:hypothetical protein [Halalkalibacter oceani]MCM3761879.1 hypothetical protein [Halalkalibacter oceani]
MDSRLSTRNNETTIQLQQKLIHYRSELKKYYRVIEKHQKKIADQAATIASLEEQLQAAPLEQPKPALPEGAEPFSCYFIYSLLVPSRIESNEEPVIIKGSFLITNYGAEPLSSPVICLAFSQPSLANISGKITHPRKRQLDEFIIEDEQLYGEWQYLEGHSHKKMKDSGEIWLRPLHLQQIDSGETVRFSDFEITLPLTTEYKNMSVKGFIYGAEIPEGQAALNQISVALT